VLLTTDHHQSMNDIMLTTYMTLLEQSLLVTEVRIAVREASGVEEPVARAAHEYRLAESSLPEFSRKSGEARTISIALVI
jgi:hypothetical protein